MILMKSLVLSHPSKISMRTTHASFIISLSLHDSESHRSTSKTNHLCTEPLFSLAFDGVQSPLTLDADPLDVSFGDVERSMEVRHGEPTE
jgi:hypothetical protein